MTVNQASAPSNLRLSGRYALVAGREDPPKKKAWDWELPLQVNHPTFVKILFDIRITYLSIVLETRQNPYFNCQ